VADDPSLTVRLEGYRGRQPLRVVLDGAGRVPGSVAVLDSSASTLVVTVSTAPGSARDAWERAGAEVMVIDDPADARRVSLSPLMTALGKRDVQTVLIEGGSTVAWSAVGGGVVDGLGLCLAPKLGGGTAAPGVLG